MVLDYKITDAAIIPVSAAKSGNLPPPPDFLSDFDLSAVMN